MNPEQEQPVTSNPQPIVTPAAQPTPTMPPNPPAQMPPAPGKQRHPLRTVLIILLLLVVVGAGVFAALTLTKQDDDNANTTNTKKDIPSLTVGQFGNTLNVFYPVNEVDDSEYAVNNQIFEGLVRYEERSKLVPALATGWSNPDQSTWVFTLRKDVTFHTGRTMTAKDVVYSLNTVKKTENLGPEFASTIKDVQAVDDYKVRITTDGPDPVLLNKLAFLSIIDSKSTKQNDPVNGTGPYVLKPNSTTTSEKVELAAFDKYWGGHVYTRQLTFVTKSDDDDLVKGLTAGQLNIGGDFSNTHPEGLNTANFTEFSVTDPTVTMIVINQVTAGPLQKLAVRQALAHAINVPELIKTTGVSAQQASQMITNEIPGYNPKVKPATYDVAQAKQMLTDAGYPSGLTLKLTYSPAQGPLVKALQQQLQAAGITLKLDLQSDFATYIGTATGGKTDLAIISFGSDLLDSSDVFSQVLQQSGNYKSSTLDENLTKAAQTIDPAKRLAILQQTSQYLSDNVAVVPLYNRTRIWFMDQPYHITQNMPGAGTGAYYWKVSQ